MSPKYSRQSVNVDILFLWKVESCLVDNSEAASAKTTAKCVEGKKISSMPG
jgi:hypothetical protein